MLVGVLLRVLGGTGGQDGLCCGHGIDAEVAALLSPLVVLDGME